jgi:hypothetical protein
MNGAPAKLKKTNTDKLIEAGYGTRFGAQWPGQRCQAQTRTGGPCQKPAMKSRLRCRLHGGASTGPKTLEGRQRISDANTKHGQRTNAKIAEAHERKGEHQKIDFALKSIIISMIEQGYLPRNFKP